MESADLYTERFGRPVKKYSEPTKDPFLKNFDERRTLIIYDFPFCEEWRGVPMTATVVASALHR